MRQLLDLVAHVQVQLLDPARCTDGPSLVPKVALEFANHVRNGKGVELDRPVRIESLDRFQERQASNLVEIVVRLASVGKSSSQVFGQAQMLFHDGVTYFHSLCASELSELLQLLIGVFGQSICH